MKTVAFIFLLAFFVKPQTEVATKFFLSKSIKTMLYSEAPLENIEATSLTGVSILNTETREIQFNIPIRSFDFKKKLMEEHFNENYLESDKYPSARFKGKINQSIDFQTDGTYNVTATGELDVHGVKKPRTINGTIKVSGGTISLYSRFETKVADHNIKIPQLVFKNIAETIQVTVTGNYTPYNKTES